MAVALQDVRALPPPLKWAGGKRWLVPRLMPLLAAHRDRRLVEPFAGGLAVALGLHPRTALLNDVSPHLISFYRWLQRGLETKAAKVEMRNDREVFARNRDRFNALIGGGEHESAEAALLFYYLNRTGFNGLCRFNASGFFNVPFGRYKSIGYREHFAEYAAMLKDYTFTSGDFERLRTTPGDLIYADPPYDVEFTSYSAGGFGWNDQERLARWLASHRGPVVASNQATHRIVRLYSELGFTVQILDAPRRISCNGNRDDAREMLAARNL